MHSFSFLTARGALCRVLLTLIVVVLSIGTARAAVTLVENGMPKAVIVSNGHQKQAENLQAYLTKISGGALPIVAASADVPAGQAAVVLQIVDAVPGASTRVTAKQAYRLRVEGNVLTLTAASEVGLHYAVWGFLEDHLGCRFYDQRVAFFRYVGPGFEVVPQRTTIRFDQLDDLQEPAFQHRGFVYIGGVDPWIEKNRGGGLPAYPTGGAVTATHNFYQYADPKAYFTAHPEWYPLKGGKRQTDWAFGLCATNPELAKEMAKNLMAVMAKWKDPDMPIAMAQGDGFTGCECPECRALVEREGSEMAPILLLLNRILEITTQQYPRHQVITFSYFDTLKTPKTLKPNPNLWINVVSSSLSPVYGGDQVGPIRTSPANRDYRDALFSWPKVAPGRVTVWDWALTSNYLCEWPNIFYIPDNVRLWQEAGINDIALQVSFTGDWAWLRDWLFMKMAWNPKADANALVKQFLTDYYGPKAAPALWEYLQTTRQAYEDVANSYVPSGVRWTYFPNTLREKMFPPQILAKMDTLLVNAERAAGKEADPIYAQHVAEARASSADILMLNQANSEKGLALLTDADGIRWLVPGGRADMPARIGRIVDGLTRREDGSAAFVTEPGAEREITSISSQFGGQVFPLANPRYAIDVTPALRGQITSIVYRPSGKEILARDGAEFGYRDLFTGITGQIWSTGGVTKTKVETGLILSPPYWGFTTANRMPRTVEFTPDGAGITITRRYEQEKGGGLPNNARFTTRWMLALPNPAQARVLVRGGGIEKMLDLRYIKAGGIRGVQVGERLPGADFMLETINDVVAVSDAQVISLPITGAEGTVAIQLDRGDGLLVALTIPAAGWEKVELQPVVDKRRLQVTLVGQPRAANNQAQTFELPAQTLEVRTAPKAEKRETPVDTTPVVAPKIRVTSPGHAINEIDGAELIWVPAGPFLMGSKPGEGSADERPQHKVTLNGYWIYRYPVTLKQYQAFVKAANREMPSLVWGQQQHLDPKADDGSYPFLCSWYAADAYARWAGGALPTEAQWEKAARGTDGRIYPWGDTWDPAKAVGLEKTCYSFKEGSMPVGSTPAGASPYGVEDMAGNVFEWVNDWYQYDYYTKAPAVNPAGPATGTHKVLRGGDSAWDERFSRTACRLIMPPQVSDWVKTGFRVAIPATGEGR